MVEVLAEIDQPRKKFKWVAGLSVLLIASLFILINVLYVGSSKAIPSHNHGDLNF
jgi:hypothetical protein